MLSGLDREGDDARAQSLARAAPTGEAVRSLPTLDDAIRAVEEVILAGPEAPARSGTDGFLAELQAMHPETDLETIFERVRLREGEVLAEEGAAPGDMFVLIEGALRAETSGSNGAQITVARFLPGALVGEIAFFAGVPRTARLVAEGPSEVARLSAEALGSGPEARAVRASLHLLSARYLARRLMSMTRVMREAGL